MKRLFSCLTVFLLAAFCGIAALGAEEEKAPSRGVTINVYNWGEYIANGTDESMDVNAEFTRRTGIQVNYTTLTATSPFNPHRPRPAWNKGTRCCRRWYNSLECLYGG